MYLTSARYDHIFVFTLLGKRNYTFQLPNGLPLILKRASCCTIQIYPKTRVCGLSFECCPLTFIQRRGFTANFDVKIRLHETFHLLLIIFNNIHYPSGFDSKRDLLVRYTLYSYVQYGI